METKEAMTYKDKEASEVPRKPLEPRNTIQIVKPKKLMIH
jgi:hypothetical protein